MIYLEKIKISKKNNKLIETQTQKKIPFKSEDLTL